MHVTMFYSLSYQIWVVQFLFSEVYNSFAHCLNLVLLHYWLLSFQKRFASLCYTSLGQTSHRFASINLLTPIIVVTLPIEARNEVLFIIVGFADHPLSNFPRSQPLITGKSYAKQFSQKNNLKHLFSVICGFRFPDSRFRCPIPGSGFRFRIPVSGF